MVESALATAPSAALRPVSPAAHLGERFAAAEVRGARAVRIREVPFLTMVGLRAVPGGAAAERLAAHLGARLPATCCRTATARERPG